jgi:hypothetical protein
MITAFMSGIATGDKILDQAALFGALSKASVCLAAAFWFFACVRLLKRGAADRPATDQLAVIAFALQLLAPVVVIFFLPREVQEVAAGVLFSVEASLSIMTIIWASGSGSMIGRRIKAALLFWVAGVIFAVGSPSMTS